MTLTPRSQMIRFLIGGGVNTLFGWLVYSAAILLGAKPWLALIVSLITGIGFNFITLGVYVFQNRVPNRFPRFVLSYGCIYAINLVCLTALKPWIDDAMWGQLLLSAPMAILSYVLLSRVVFDPTVIRAADE